MRSSPAATWTGAAGRRAARASAAAAARRSGSPQERERRGRRTGLGVDCARARREVSTASTGSTQADDQRAARAERARSAAARGRRRGRSSRSRRLCSTPNTRASTSSATGALQDREPAHVARSCWRSDERRGDEPATVSARSPTSRSGAPQRRRRSRSPSRAAGARRARSRRARRRSRRPRPPRSGSRRPPAPRSSSCSAETTIRTPKAPVTSVCAEKSPTSSRSRGSRADRAEAGRRLARQVRPLAAQRRLGRAQAAARSISADQRKSAAVTTKTTQPLETASRRPPSAGPTQKPRLSIVLELTFAAVSSSGVFASDGSSAACAGLEGRVDHRDRAGQHVDDADRGVRRARRRPSSPSPTARSRSEASITGTRG